MIHCSRCGKPYKSKSYRQTTDILGEEYEGFCQECENFSFMTSNKKPKYKTGILRDLI